MSSIIEDLIARKIFNNRGEETIEVDVITSGGFGRAAAPAGKSRGKAEVIYYPQGGVEAAIKKVDDLIAPELAGLNADFQEEIDNTLHELDGTTDFKNIGGNTAFAISLANAEAAANSHGMLLFQFLGGNAATTLPYPLGNCISGGAHAGEKHQLSKSIWRCLMVQKLFLKPKQLTLKFTKKLVMHSKRKAPRLTAAKAMRAHG